MLWNYSALKIIATTLGILVPNLRVLDSQNQNLLSGRRAVVNVLQKNLNTLNLLVCTFSWQLWFLFKFRIKVKFIMRNLNYWWIDIISTFENEFCWNVKGSFFIFKVKSEISFWCDLKIFSYENKFFPEAMNGISCYRRGGIKFAEPVRRDSRRLACLEYTMTT